MSEKKDELISIVGAENVTDDTETLDAFSKDQSFTSSRKPRLVIKPKNEDEVQKTVQWANQTGTPLVPVSSGAPHFRGDTVPGTGGAVIVDLSRMKQILQIDRRNRVTIVESGVTYPQLQQELARQGLTLSAPLLPRNNKSVVASLLEREPTIIPRYQGSLMEPLRCLGVIWGNGERFNTGSASCSVPLLQHGPGQSDWYRLISAAQGSMGIVTWASLRTKILPQIHKLFFVPSKKLDDLFDFAYRVLRFRFGDELLFLNGSNLAYIIGGSADQVRALRDELPSWVLILGVAGRERLPKERVEFQERDITSMAKQSGLRLLDTIPGHRDGKMSEVLLNPSREPYWKLGYKGSNQDIFFLTTLNRVLEYINTMYQVAGTLGYPIEDIGVYIQPVHQGVACHCEFNLPFDPTSQEEITRMKELFTRASEELIRQEAFFSRPYGIWASMVYNRDATTTIALRKVKKIFDPNNIMNPGKLCF